jgi:maltose O-acetyltransferase
MAHAGLLLKRLLERGIRLKDFSSSLRILGLKIRYGKRLQLASFSLGMEKGCSILAAKGAAIHLGHLVYLRKGTDIEAHDQASIHIGDKNYFGKCCTIVARISIRVGNNCLFGEDVSIYDHNHGRSRQGIPFREQGYECRAVSIGNNVWIGAKSFIAAGVTIGDNVIVGAGSVITKDIPSSTIAFNRTSTELRSLYPLAEALQAEDLRLP